MENVEWQFPLMLRLMVVKGDLKFTEKKSLRKFSETFFFFKNYL